MLKRFSRAEEQDRAEDARERHEDPESSHPDLVRRIQAYSSVGPVVERDEPRFQRAGERTTA